MEEQIIKEAIKTTKPLSQIETAAFYISKEQFISTERQLGFPRADPHKSKD